MPLHSVRGQCHCCVTAQGEGTVPARPSPSPAHPGQALPGAGSQSCQAGWKVLVRGHQIQAKLERKQICWGAELQACCRSSGLVPALGLAGLWHGPVPVPVPSHGVPPVPSDLALPPTPNPDPKSFPWRDKGRTAALQSPVSPIDCPLSVTSCHARGCSWCGNSFRPPWRGDGTEMSP